jgi:hypothetical protein
LFSRHDSIHVAIFHSVSVHEFRSYHRTSAMAPLQHSSRRAAAIVSSR